MILLVTIGIGALGGLIVAIIVLRAIDRRERSRKQRELESLLRKLP